jgi:hypothetical protein
VVAADVPELLAALAHRSLLDSVRTGRPGGPSLFRQLATVRGHAAHALAASDEAEEAVRRRDAWVTALLAGRPRLSRAGGDWYAAVTDAYPTVRATLQRLLADDPQPSGGRLLADLSMFWYFRARTVEAARWLGLALSIPGLDPADAAHAHLTLTAHALLRGRADLAGPHLDSALRSIRDWPTDRLVDLAEVMAAVALAAETQQAGDLVALLVTAVAELAAGTGDRDVALLSDALSLLGPAAPDGPRGSATDVHERACADGNLLAAWVASTVASGQAATAEDAIRWCDRQAELQVLLGAQDSGILAERRAGLMVADGRYRDAVRLFAAARQHLRRTGLPWPLMPDTRGLMRHAHRALGDAAHDRAWHDGERSTAAALMVELRAEPGGQPPLPT